MLKLGNTSDSSGHGSQRSPRRVLLGLRDLPPLNCEETVAPQLLATEPLKIKGITRAQSSGNVVFSFPDRSFRLWQGNELCPHGLLSDPRWSFAFSSLSAGHLENHSMSAWRARLFWGCWHFLWVRGRFLKVGFLFVSPQKLLALQAYLFPFSTLFWNTFSASFDANFMTLPVGNILLKRGWERDWVMKVVKAVNWEPQAWEESG